MKASIAADVTEQLALHSTGVSFNPNAAIACQREAGQLQDEGRVGVIGALLYFCTGSVHFIQPIIQGVWLPAKSGNRIDTAVIYICGVADVVMSETRVIANNTSTAIAVDGSARLIVKSSTFTKNMGDPGAAIFSQGSTVLDIANSSFTDNYSRDYGGALAMLLCSQATVSSSSFDNNSAEMSGGAVLAEGEMTLLLRDSTLQHNSAGSGGAVMCTGAELRLERTNITDNAAVGPQGSGGGLFLTAGAAMELSRAVVSNNTAQQGGGAFLAASVAFNAAELTSSVVRNVATVADNDLSTNPTLLEVLGSRYISRFVAGSDEGAGLLKVRLHLSGHGGLIPCGNQRVEAFWQSSLPGAGPKDLQLPSGDCEAGSSATANALPKAAALSLRNGTVDFALRFRQPPGNHTSVFQVALEGGCPVTANITVNVHACKPGEREVKAGVCDPCAPQSFSFVALNSSGACTACPEGAECPGADVVVSKPGWWQSSLGSGQMHRCPNPEACSRNRSAFIQACVAKDASKCIDSRFIPAQCASAAACTGRLWATISLHWQPLWHVQHWLWL
ncbi:hypothetical protein OEZ85_013784 [Tetradesmus obliquus]|uniref:Right handed beta helix domain-containing protein n=1 Tax=Tetradesmus obliquus TaxID=3088 RepID=A0ABY8U8S1_TETOB|nr:hypothetical protein OEZ85_013784 [Tetradesmus obliquus]